MSKNLILLLLLINLVNVNCQNADLFGFFLSFFDNTVDNLLSFFKGWLDTKEDASENAEIGRYFSPRMEHSTSKSLKKMALPLLPLIFHVGATSTWIILTGLLAAKSVAIGLAILVFKIAVSSAKVASFFTSFKAKHSSHGQEWSPSWSPSPHEYGQDRSYTDNGLRPYEDSYQPIRTRQPPTYEIPLKGNEGSEQTSLIEERNKESKDKM